MGAVGEVSKLVCVCGGGGGGGGALCSRLPTFSSSIYSDRNMISDSARGLCSHCGKNPESSRLKHVEFEYFSLSLSNFEFH